MNKRGRRSGPLVNANRDRALLPKQRGQASHIADGVVARVGNEDVAAEERSGRRITEPLESSFQCQITPFGAERDRDRSARNIASLGQRSNDIWRPDANINPDA